MSRLDGRAALVTGGRQGIGRAIVDAFVAEGADVATCGRGERPQNLPPTLGWRQTDVSSADDIEDLRIEMLDRFGGLDILVNNAGIQIEKGAVDVENRIFLDGFDELIFGKIKKENI